MMTLKLREIVALTVLLTAVTACSKSQNGADDSALGPGRVATVNGKPIAESVLRVYALASSRKNLDDLSAEERGKLLDDLIGVELLSQQAEKEGLATSRTLAAQLELQRLQLLGRTMATSYLDKNPATEDDLKQVYEENLPRLATQEYKARHILVDTKDEAEGIIAQLRDGKDFAVLAKEHGAKMGANGPDLGWFTAQSMVPQIMTAIATMKVGSFSTEPVQSDYGYHVLMLDDTRTREAPTLESLRKDLTTAVDRKHLEEFIKTLRSGASVTLGP